MQTCRDSSGSGSRCGLVSSAGTPITYSGCRLSKSPSMLGRFMPGTSSRCTRTRFLARNKLGLQLFAPVVVHLRAVVALLGARAAAVVDANEVQDLGSGKVGP